MAKKRMSAGAAARSIAKREGIPVKNAAGILKAANIKEAKARKKNGK